MTKHKLFDMLYTCAALIICLGVGKAANFLLSGLPASLYGMIIFTLCLRQGFVDAKRVKKTIKWIIANMGVCFVPAGVGAIHYLDLLANQGLAIVLMVFVTTMGLMAAVGLITEKFISPDSQQLPSNSKQTSELGDE